MANTLVQDLIEAGIHFGQRASGWNPKMQPFIYGKRNGIHIIDIKETVKGLLLAKKYIAKSVAEGKDVCFVGTKRQAKSVLETRVPDVKMHYVTERWLGGTLTNFRTIRQRLRRLEELDAIERNDNFSSYSKKMESQLKREQRKIARNLNGIRGMERLPGCLVVIDVRSEITALREARKLGIPTIALIDTDGDPELVDIVIPGNDDSMRSIDVVVRELCLAAAEGRQMREEKAAAANAGASPGGESPDMSGAGPAGPQGEKPRRSRRAQFRSDEPNATPEGNPVAAG
ncbi:MAG TPA: 30S ribosomal protein S2 [Phycisphaerales bacterium]|nr:30S ribosomal protein S2 [Phycisphaerales bacterium]